MTPKCERVGHDWFPGDEPREFIPVPVVCLRCQRKKTVLPWGDCLTGHPIAEHYDKDGELIERAGCAGPA